MREGVVTDIMSLGQDALHQARTSLGILTDDEETRVDALLLENIEDLRRPVGIGPVVEGERELARCRPRTFDDIGCRERGVLLVDDLSGIFVDLEGSLAFC